MIRHGLVRLSICVFCLLALAAQNYCVAETDEAKSFRQILELAEVGPDVLAKLSNGSDYSEKDWQVLLQVLLRLRQFESYSSSESPTALSLRLDDAGQRQEKVGTLFSLDGIIDQVEELPLPPRVASRQDFKSLFRCQFRLLDNASNEPNSITVLASQVPSRWLAKQSFHEPVRVRGVLVRAEFNEDGGWQALLLTNHVAWYPSEAVPSGQLLLARQGMDVSLFDEVRHGRPFEKPQVSREGEAFYAGLKAIGQVEQQEIVRFAKENIALGATRWRQKQEETLKGLKALTVELTVATDPESRKLLEKKIKRAKTQSRLATEVIKQGNAGRSSVAPPFLQPAEEMGELLLFEGTTRRAVWVAVEEEEGLEGYYELQVYPSESRLLNNQPVVCCLINLPEGFPLGDEIRVPVRAAGVFFKYWRYRSRKARLPAGETDKQRGLYTYSPVVLGNTLTRLSPATVSEGYGAFWGGVAFLAMLGTLWIVMVWLSRSDRSARKTLQRNETIDL